MGERTPLDAKPSRLCLGIQFHRIAAYHNPMSRIPVIGLLLETDAKPSHRVPLENPTLQSQTVILHGVRPSDLHPPATNSGSLHTPASNPRGTPADWSRSRVAQVAVPSAPCGVLEKRASKHRLSQSERGEAGRDRIWEHFFPVEDFFHGTWQLRTTETRRIATMTSLAAGSGELQLLATGHYPMPV